jgi:diguanylate cyclase (GGDEF)-like protein
VLIKGNFLHSRVAKRVFGLFILSAFIPVCAMALLSLGQVNRQSAEQGRAQIDRAASAYGKGLYERLLMADKLVEQSMPALMEGDDFSSAAARVTGEVVKSLVLIAPEMASDLGLRLPATETARLNHWTKGKPLLAYFYGGRSMPRPALVYAPAGAAASSPLLIAELDPAFLWGGEELLPYSTQLCVLDEAHAPLFCYEALPESARELLVSTLPGSSVGRLDWDDAGERYLAGYREVLLEPRFLVPRWVVLAAQPDAYVLAPIATFNKSFAWVVLLSVLGVSLLSLIQIRRTLVPLEKLTDATRRITGQDFASPVAVDRDDEFGELATAFNGMAGRLGRQFRAMTALSEIDHVILEGGDTERVLETVLQRAAHVVPADVIAITVLDRETTGGARTWLDPADKARQPAGFRCTVDDSVVRHLTVRGRGDWLEAGRCESFLCPVAWKDTSRFFALPVFWNERLSAILSFGYRGGRELAEEEVGHAHDFAGRVGVALSAAVRDEELHYQARHDPLTALPNRMLFKDRLAQEIARAARERRTLALLFLDLDRFKNVNDSIGHTAGDKLLQQAALRLRECTRDSDTLARFGGDEFVLLLPGIVQASDAGKVAQHLIDVLREPFQIGDHEHYIGASIGISVFPGDGRTDEELLSNADKAMYRAKANGRGQYVFFEEQMNAEALQKFALERELRQALDNDEFVLVYQPQIDLRTGWLIGAEALVRWNHPRRGLLTPFHFIDIAEEAGLIEAIGRRVLNLACAQLRAWQDLGLSPPRIAVNVSSPEFRRDEYYDNVVAALQQHRLPPTSLELEVTESVVIDDIERVIALLQRLHDLGVRIAIDDFGTGYSSLSYLQRLPFHRLKIDRSFVQEIGSGGRSSAIPVTIIAMAHALEKEVVAEGVETDEQRRFLEWNGCQIGQGYFFSRPIPADAFAAYMQRASRPPVVDEPHADGVPARPASPALY